LAFGIAHEINTPIQYIGDNGHFLGDAFRDLLDVATAGSESGCSGASASGRSATATAVDVDYLRTEVPKAIGQLLEGVDHVARIVRAMKEFSHPGPVEKTPVDINRAIESIILVSRNEWKYSADLLTDLDPDLPRVPCLGSRLNQVILNLIVNAAHAISAVVQDSENKGTITISTRHCAEWAEIRVIDTGCGIPEAIRSQVFDPFFTTKDVGKGTGQGLALAHAVIVQEHGGTIGFESEEGSGTTFTIRLRLEQVV
jgi:signal transduction histidine kinase